MSDVALGNFDGKRLVVFGAGYVGGALTEAALRRGMKVTALTRNPAKAETLRALGSDVVLADLTSFEWHENVARADYVVNCVSSGGGGAAAYEKSYVEGMRSVVAWLEKQQPRVDALLYTSSTSVYPQSGVVVDEDAPVDGASGTAAVLVRAEAEVRRAAETGACKRAIVLRLAGIYGPSRHHVLDQLRTGEGPIAGRGTHRLNLIHRDDIVSAILHALARAKGSYSLFNVVDDAPAPKEELVRWLAEQLGLPFPGFSGEPVAGRRPSPPDRSISNAKLKRELGWAPRFPNYRAGYASILGA